MLHRFILSRATSEYDFSTSKQGSLAALETVYRIIVDIAYSLCRIPPDAGTDVFPPMCLYLARAGLQNFQEMNKLDSTEWMDDFEALSKMLEYHNKRWNIASKSVSITISLSAA